MASNGIIPLHSSQGLQEPKQFKVPSSPSSTVPSSGVEIITSQQLPALQSYTLKESIEQDGGEPAKKWLEDWYKTLKNLEDNRAKSSALDWIINPREGTGHPLIPPHPNGGKMNLDDPDKTERYIKVLEDEVGFSNELIKICRGILKLEVNQDSSQNWRWIDPMRRMDNIELPLASQGSGYHQRYVSPTHVSRIPGASAQEDDATPSSAQQHPSSSPPDLDEPDTLGNPSDLSGPPPSSQYSDQSYDEGFEHICEGNRGLELVDVLVLMG